MMKLKLMACLLLFSNYCFGQMDTTKISVSTESWHIQYPKNWQIGTSKMMGTEFFILAPLENEQDNFRENVNMIIQDLAGQPIDLEKYKEITDEQLAGMAASCTVLESAVVSSDNKNYYKAIYTMTQKNFTIKVMSICFIKNGKAYLATFSAELDKYEQYQKTGEAILDTFGLK